MGDVAPPAPKMPTQLLSPSGDAYEYNLTSGTFKLDTLEMHAGTDDKWVAGKSAVVTITGSVNNLQILAGTAKYKMYEMYSKNFIDQGSSDFFHCTSKGCNTSEPISLKLLEPGSKYSKFTLTMPFTM